MNTEILNKIILLSKDEFLSGKTYKDKLDNYLDFQEKVDNSYDECRKTRQGLLLIKKGLMILDLLVERSNIKSSRKKMIPELFEISKDKITGDFSSFLDAKSNYEVFVDDFQYSAVVPYDKLKKLSIIWGEANFQKLHNFENLENLKVVMGDVYISDAINTSGLSNLQVITGNLHMENVDYMDNLKNLTYVGGKIYINNGIIDNNIKEKIKVK